MTDQGTPEPVSDLQEDFQFFDLEKVKEWAGFVLRSVRRRRRRAVVAFLVAASLAAAVILALPRMYHVQTQLLAQRNSLMPALGNPGRTVPSDADVPTRAAADSDNQIPGLRLLERLIHRQ